LELGVVNGHKELNGNTTKKTAIAGIFNISFA
jgi:hypothetical protein